MRIGRIVAVGVCLGLLPCAAWAQGFGSNPYNRRATAPPLPGSVGFTSTIEDGEFKLLRPGPPRLRASSRYERNLTKDETKFNAFIDTRAPGEPTSLPLPPHFDLDRVEYTPLSAGVLTGPPSFASLPSNQRDPSSELVLNQSRITQSTIIAPPTGEHLPPLPKLWKGKLEWPVSVNETRDRSGGVTLVDGPQPADAVTFAVSTHYADANAQSVAACENVLANEDRRPPREFDCTGLSDVRVLSSELLAGAESASAPLVADASQPTSLRLNVPANRERWVDTLLNTRVDACTPKIEMQFARLSDVQPATRR